MTTATLKSGLLTNSFTLPEIGKGAILHSYFQDGALTPENPINKQRAFPWKRKTPFACLFCVNAINAASIPYQLRE